MSKLGLAALVALMLTACGGGGGGNGGNGGSGSGGGASGTASSSVSSATSSVGASASSGSASSQVVMQPTAAGQAIGGIATALIGAAGGQLSTADAGLTITVPPGAFSKNETVTIQEISNEAHGAAGRSYRIRPEGLITPLPMTLTFKYRDMDLQGTTAGLTSIAYQDANGFWHGYKAPQRDKTAHTLSVQTSHFSDWSMFAGARLFPQTALVKINSTVALSVKHCDLAGDDDAVLTSPIASCSSDVVTSLSTHDWAASSGIVTPDPDPTLGNATYTAPAKVPAANPVAVSVAYAPPFADGPEILVSNITVFDPAAGCASIANADTLEGTFNLDYSFVGTKANGTRMTVSHSAKLTAHLVRDQRTANSVSWIGRTFGIVGLDESRVTADAIPYTTSVRDTLGVPDNSATEDINSSHIYLTVDLTRCTYTTALAVEVQAQQIDSPPPNSSTGIRALGAVRSDWRPLTSITSITNAGDFTTHSEDWGYANGGDAYFPSSLAQTIFDEHYAAEGVAGTARVAWSFMPTH